MLRKPYDVINNSIFTRLRRYNEALPSLLSIYVFSFNQNKLLNRLWTCIELMLLCCNNDSGTMFSNCIYYWRLYCIAALIMSPNYTPCTTKLLGGILVSLRPSVRLSVRPSRIPCPLCSAYRSGSYLYILSSNFRRCVACKMSCKIS